MAHSQASVQLLTTKFFSGLGPKFTTIVFGSCGNLSMNLGPLFRRPSSASIYGGIEERVLEYVGIRAQRRYLLIQRGYNPHPSELGSGFTGRPSPSGLRFQANVVRSAVATVRLGGDGAIGRENGGQRWVRGIGRQH